MVASLHRWLNRLFDRRPIIRVSRSRLRKRPCVRRWLWLLLALGIGLMVFTARSVTVDPLAAVGEASWQAETMPVTP